MPKFIFYFFLLIPFISISQDENEKILKGLITHISSDSVITIAVSEGHLPEIGQEVDVFKLFKIFGGDGSMGVADGKVKSSSDSEVRVQVLLYTSTMVQDGKRIPMVKVDQVAELKWTGEGTVVANFNSAYKSAKALVEEKRYSEAIPAFTDLIENYEVDWTVYHYRGEAYFKTGQNEECIPDLTKAIELQPKDMQARLYRAFANKKLDNHQAAIDDLSWLIENGELQKSDMIFMLKERAYEKVELDDFAGACVDVKQVLSLDPRDLTAYNFINKNCGENGPFDYPDSYANRMTASVTYQSTDGYKFKVKPLKEGESCMFNESTAYTTKIEVGTQVTGFSCSDSFKMTTCVLEVVASSKNEIEFKVLFWTNSMNDEPSITKFKIGETFNFAWN